MEIIQRNQITSDPFHFTLYIMLQKAASLTPINYTDFEGSHWLRPVDFGDPGGRQFCSKGRHLLFS